MHSTKNPNDGYLGSGRRIKAEVKKYGKENFEKVILEELPTRKALEDREREIVSEDLMKDPLCLNLKNGGEGGGQIWNEEHRKKFMEAAAASTGKLKLLNLSAETLSRRSKNAAMTRTQNGTHHRTKHSDLARQKISESMTGKQSGEKNSQFGSCWVTDGVKPIKIRKEQLDEYIRNGYSRGRS